MIKNYLTIAIRNFRRHKLFSLINISGLSIGISAALVIFMIVSHDFSFDKFEKDRERIYRVVSTMHFPDQLFPNSGVPVPMMAAVKQEMPGIDLAASFFLVRAKVSIDTGAYKPVIYKQQPGQIFADQSYFSLISYQWLAGSPQVLREPFRVVLTESRARVYFKDRDIAKALGRIITYNDSVKLTLAGIVKDPSERTDFTFKEFISYPTIEKTGFKNEMNLEEWGSVSSSTQFFLKLKKGIKPAQVEKQLAAIYKKHEKDRYLSITYKAQPLNDIHFNAEYDNFDQRQAHKPTLYGLLALAAFLLILGCINFINLTTAQGAQRAKEIGIRKTMGSLRRQLVVQFLTETFLLTTIATLFAIVLAPGLLRVFSSFIPPEISLDNLKQGPVILFLTGLILVISFLSGLYPALFLSSYNPSAVLKNQAFNNSARTRNAWLRKTLTVSQFVIAQFFIIAAMMVARQINYIFHKDLGFKKDAIITFQVPYRTPKDQTKYALLQKIKSIPGIEAISLAGYTPAVQGTSMSTMKFFGDQGEIETTVEIKNADSNYFRVFGLKLLAGRFLEQSDTTREYLINNTYARFLGYQNPADIIGKLIDRGRTKVPIVGVLADFHSHSLHASIQPLAFSSAGQSNFNFHIALQKTSPGSGSWKKTIGSIERSFREIYPEENFNYEFFDERIAGFYEAEQKISKLLTWATTLAIFISCLGLLGLVIYTTGIRTKEIGIRKVLGASVVQIVSLLSKDFLLLVLAAILIAVPAAWWALHKWLEEFAYRATISWWIFPAAGAFMIIIALLTLSIQTIRSATANPVKSLRTE